MSREMTTAMADALAAKLVRPLLIIKAEYPGGAVRLHSGKGNITFSSETYAGTGGLGMITGIVESLDDTPGNASIAFPAKSAQIALALGEQPRGCRCRIWFGARDLSSLSLIADPFLLFSGTISHHTGTDPIAANGTVTLHCIDESADQDRPLEERYTDEEQQRMHPGDLGCQYVADLPNKEFTWGNAQARITTPSPPTTTTDPDQG